MSQSLYTAMGGISAANTELSVISNNVANINTTAFKSSSVQFSDVYSTTLSYGSVSTSTSGGTNPIQVGVGTQVSAVSTDFNTGSWNATGKNTDLMINGSGFFSVQATDGTTYYTRAGNFSIDENGNLVTSNGYKVEGTDTNLSTTPSSTTVKIPTAITAIVSGNDLTSATGSAEKVSDLNGTKSDITSGYFQVSVNGGANVNVIVKADGTVQNMIDEVNACFQANASTQNLTATANSDGTMTISDSSSSDTVVFTTPTASASIVDPATSTSSTFTASNFLTQTGIGTEATGTTGTTATAFTNITAAAVTGGTFTVSDTAGISKTITLAAAGTYTTPAALADAINSQLKDSGLSAKVTSTGAIQFTSASASDTISLTAGTSSFVADAGGAALTAGTATGNYVSNTLDYAVHVTDLTSSSTSANSETIGTDGSLQVTYKDGSTLSVEQKTDGTYGFIFTTANSSVPIDGEKCVVDASVAVPSNFVIQMATVTNTEGLLSVGNNMYAAGPNTGDIVYTVAGDMGCGKVASGGLESSNVDLAGELSNMILAQRAIQANSRVFTTTTTIMNTINQMGQ